MAAELNGCTRVVEVEEAMPRVLRLQSQLALNTASIWDTFGAWRSLPGLEEAGENPGRPSAT